METIFVIFALGVMVSLVIAKGVMQAHDFTRQELDKQGVPAEEKGSEQ